MEKFISAWNYCVSKFKSNPKTQVDPQKSSKNEQIHMSIDQALGFSNTLYETSNNVNQILRQSLSISSALTTQTFNEVIIKIIFSNILNQLALKSTSLAQEKMPHPNITHFDVNDVSLQKKKITHVYKCQRENKYILKDIVGIKLVTQHSDTIICSNDTCLLASFHENVSRVDLGIYKKGQAQAVYAECLEYIPQEQKQFSDALQSIENLKKEKYELFNNNCQHSSEKLISSLDSNFNRKINLEQL
ncbi:unnamed protein product [Paramecium sonneborni]|uniref:LRAT domain-containing protein n=1 Tax=Paramecium sonneborni TaxID=65129 RepID=A0A8S1NMJ2_9CILI|nr:unnamed protein product [Paramecium sonneborni]